MDLGVSGAVSRRRRAVSGARALSSLVLATVLSALIVVADRMVAWTESHLMVAIIVLWLVLFAGLALLAGTVRRWTYRIATGYQGWLDSAAQERRDSTLLELARHDARMMNDLRAAVARNAHPDLSPRLAHKIYYRPW